MVLLLLRTNLEPLPVSDGFTGVDGAAPNPHWQPRRDTSALISGNRLALRSTSGGQSSGIGTLELVGTPLTTDVEIYVTVQTAQVDADQFAFVGVQSRRSVQIDTTVSGNVDPQAYYAQVNYFQGQTPKFDLWQGTTQLATTVDIAGATYASQIRVRVQASQGVLRGKAWVLGSSEPAWLGTSSLSSQNSGVPWLSAQNGGTGVDRTLMFDDYVASAPATATGDVKVYLAGSFQPKPAKVWNGTAWVKKPVKAWTGSSWKTTSY